MRTRSAMSNPSPCLRHGAKGKSLPDPVISQAPIPLLDSSALDGYAEDNAGFTGEDPWILEPKFSSWSLIPTNLDRNY